MKMEPIKEEYD